MAKEKSAVGDREERGGRCADRGKEEGVSGVMELFPMRIAVIIRQIHTRIKIHSIVHH